ncbi:MAG TPA: M23 family metallopeptidase [Rectinemataceae bacterium]|nr:M23 family metallopeptidase [Rectinemataceae bacterium]
MESIIRAQKISRRRNSDSKSPLRIREAFIPDHLGPRKAPPTRLELPLLPIAARMPAFPAADGSGRFPEFRQKPAARRHHPPERGQKSGGNSAHRLKLPGPRRDSFLPARALRALLRSLGAAFARALGASRAFSTRMRLALGLVALSALLAVVAAAILLHPAVPLPQGTLLPQGGTDEGVLLAYAASEETTQAEAAGGAQTQAAKAAPSAQDAKNAPLPVLELSTYTVQKNDSLSTVAQRFGIAVDTLISMNGIKDARALQLGAKLRVPNMNGLLYQVRAGDSLYSIAKLFNIESGRIADANDLGSSVIKVGQRLFIPGAKLPDTELKRIFGTRVSWPVHGYITSPYGYRADPFTGVRFFHAGIDIAVDLGTPVKAAMDGKVVDVGYNPTFGNYVILGHPDGIQSLYAHLSSYSVRIGQRLRQGTQLGLSGSTGYSTGPHLHFGLYLHGNPVNPLKYLR